MYSYNYTCIKEKQESAVGLVMAVQHLTAVFASTVGINQSMVGLVAGFHSGFSSRGGKSSDCQFKGGRGL